MICDGSFGPDLIRLGGYNPRCQFICAVAPAQTLSEVEEYPQKATMTPFSVATRWV